MKPAIEGTTGFAIIAPTMSKRPKIRRRLLGLALGALAPLMGACGFEPLYADRADRGDAPSVAQELARVRVALIPNRSGQILRNYLLDELTPRGQRGESSYTLTIRLNEPRQEVGLRRDDIPTRISYGSIAYFVLADSGGRPVHNGASVSSTTFQITDSEFATIAARESARERTLQELSTDIRQQLATFFYEQARKR